MLPPSPITSSCHVLAHSTMFFCAILYRRQIWIERSCCARNWQLRQWWAPKGLHRIYDEQQQLSSLPSLKGLRQKPVSASVWDPSPFFVSNVHIRMYTYTARQFISVIENTLALFYFKSALEKYVKKKRSAYDYFVGCARNAQMIEEEAILLANLLDFYRYTQQRKRKIAEPTTKRMLHSESSECRVDLRSNTLHWCHSRGRTSEILLCTYSKLGFKVEIDFRPLDFVLNFDIIITD